MICDRGLLAQVGILNSSFPATTTQYLLALLLQEAFQMVSSL